MRIRLHKNKESLEAENKWWEGLSDEQKDAEIKRRNKEDVIEDSIRMVVGLIVLILVVVVPFILGIREIVRLLF